MSAEPVATVTLWELAHRRPLTIDDLSWDDDEPGRHELIEGGLYVSPSADRGHARIIVRLGARLLSLVPDGLDVFGVPNVFEGRSTAVVPDLVVADDEQDPSDTLAFDPASVRLIVEITSPSNRMRELTIKRQLYADWGVPYVVLDRSKTPHVWLSFGDLPTWAEPLTRDTFG